MDLLLTTGLLSRELEVNLNLKLAPHTILPVVTYAKTGEPTSLAPEPCFPQFLTNLKPSH